MSDFSLQKIVLGHNQFFGVDHLSAVRGAQRAAYFSENSRILNMIHTAYENGATGMMMSTHERAADIAEMLRNEGSLANKLAIYPLLPYVQKYVVAANEKGMLNVVFDALSGTKFSQKLAMIWKGGKGILAKDINAILSAMIRLELKTFQRLRMEAVFLHDVFTDLALALNLQDVFEFYLEEIQKLFGAQGAFTTKNLPTLLKRFSAWGLARPVVMTHFNKAGYHMNPSRKACEDAVSKYDVTIMAMGSLASGYLGPDEAYEYLAKISKVDSVVVGVSSEVHAKETFAAIKKYGLG
jgi:hypothetical protein